MTAIWRKISPRQTATAVWTLAIAAGSAAAQVPDWIPSPDDRRSAPIWVAEEHALGPADSLLPDVLTERERESLLRQLEDLRANIARERAGGARPDADGCWVSTFAVQPHVVDDLTFDNLLAVSNAALVGRIIDSRAGFFHGSVASLAAIQIEQVLKAPAALDTESLLGGQAFVLHADARIEIEGLRVCHRTPRGSSPDAEGSRILVFARGIPYLHPLVLNPLDDELYFERDDGSLSVPSRLGDLEQKPSWALVQSWLDRMAIEGTAVKNDGFGAAGGLRHQRRRSRGSDRLGLRRRR